MTRCGPHSSSVPQCRRLLFAASLLLFLSSSAQTSAGQGSDRIGQVFVRVRDRVNEEPLAQAQVQLIRFPDGIIGEQFTGADGGVQFSGISVGAYTIRASRHGYETGEVHVDFRKGDATLQSVDIPLATVKHDGLGASAGTISMDNLRVPKNARREFERGVRLLNEKKQPRDSIVAFQRAIELYPDYPDAYFLMASAQMQINAVPAAEASLRKVISLDSHTLLPYYPLAILLFSQKKYAEEQQVLAQAQALDGADWRWPFELARCEAQQRRWEPALQHALESLKLPGVATKVHLLLGDIYSNVGRIQEAIAELELFVKLDPGNSYVARVNQVLPELRRQLASNASARPQ